MSERIAIVDLGSNSARLIIFDIFTNGSYNLIYNQKEHVRLSQAAENDHKIQPTAWQRALETLTHFGQMCKILKVDKTFAVATAAARNATNGEDFINEARNRTSLPLRIISGEEEARLGYLGIINTIDISDALLFDLGGGSTEISYVKNRQLIDSFSVPLGAVNSTEIFECNANDHDASKSMLVSLQKELRKIPWLSDLHDSGLPLIGIGGTARTITKIDQIRKKYPQSRIHNYKVSVTNFNSIWQLITTTPLSQRWKIGGLSRDRAELILAGSAIIKAIFNHVTSPYMLTGGYGLREGLFFEYLISSPDSLHYKSISHNFSQPIIPDILDFSARNLLHQHALDERHADHVSGLALQLFKSSRQLHYLGNRQATLLKTAALLHDTGIAIDYYSHPRHSAYIIENARLFGLSHREQSIVALVAGWHHGAFGRHNLYRQYQDLLTDNDWNTVQKLSVLLAMAESLDINRLGNIQNIAAECDDHNFTIYIDKTTDIEPECKSLREHQTWFHNEFSRNLCLKIR